MLLRPGSVPLPLQGRSPGVAAAVSGRFGPDLDLGGMFAPHPGPPVAMAGHAPDGTFVLAVGAGPVQCSSSRVLDRRLIHDVNGFYAALGVEASAGRHALAKAYYARGGPASAWLTMVVKILLDPVQRRVYDLAPLGVRFNDPDTRAAMRRADALYALRNPGKTCTDSSETMHGLADDARYWWEHTPEQGSGRRFPAAATAPTTWDWGYAYHLWSAPRATPDRLPAWQQMIIAALDGGGGPVLFAVGHSRPGSTATVADIGGVPTAFLPHGTAPTEQLAALAAEQLRRPDTVRTP